MDKKIILFGLNADPPHLGHLKLVQEVRKKMEPDAFFVIMPTGFSPYNKAQSASGADRLAMTELLFGQVSYAKVDDFEIRSKNKSYTLDSLIHLKTTYPHAELYFLIGADAAAHFFSWHEPAKILQLARPIIASRKGYVLNPEILEKITKITPSVYFEIETLPFSSTEIRTSLSYKTFSPYLSHEVNAYILQHSLYLKK